MMKTTKVFLGIAVILIAALFNSCEDTLGLEKDVKQIKSLNFETMKQSSTLYFTKPEVKTVIRNSEEEAAFISLIPLKIHEDAIRAMIGFDKIDYSRDMVIVLGLGESTNSSNYVNIDGIESKDGKIYVSSTQYVFPQSAGQKGYPVHIVSVKTSTDEVVFEATKIKEIQDENTDRIIPFETILKGNHIVQYPYGVPNFNMLITDKTMENTWLSMQVTGRQDEFGNEIKLTLPETDYSKYNLIVMQPGVTTSGSNVFEISQVKLEGGKVNIYSSITTNGMTTDIGNPLHVIRVEKLALEHIFLATKVLPFNDPENPLNLKGTTWRWTSYVNSLGVMFDVNAIPGYEDDATIKSENFTITFDESTFAGKSNCNIISGKYQISADNVQFLDITTTKAFCNMSNQFTSGISQAYKIYRTGDKLSIQTYDYDRMNMYFERVQ